MCIFYQWPLLLDERVLQREKCIFLTDQKNSFCIFDGDSPTSMKKVFILFLYFVTITCSKETEPSTDPIIGDWEATLYNREVIAGQVIAYTFEGTLSFYEGGTALQKGSIRFGTEIQEISEAFTWQNRGMTPDFSRTSQSYLIDGAINFVVFSEDFNYAQVTDEEGDTIEVYRR